MGLFTTLFGTSTTEEGKKVIPWKVLTTKEQLDEIEKISKDKLVAIFKHSTRCGTSRMVLRSFEKDFNLELENVEIYIIDLLNYRSLSDEIATRFQVTHQSPQLILIKDGAVIEHYSHNKISAAAIEQYA